MAGEVSKHKPVNLTDPDSPCQIVGLQTYQTLRLRLTREHYDAPPHVSIMSKFVSMKTILHEEKYIEYEIVQTPFAIGRNACSTFFLGEVRVNDNNLILYQNNDTLPYKNTITVVEPTFESIRIKPFQYLEVVLMTNGMPNFNDKWNWYWTPGNVSCGMEEIGYRFVYGAYLENDGNVECHPYNMIKHSEDDQPCCMQHHFWFRCEREVISLLGTSQRGVYLGRLLFRQGNRATPCMMNVYIDLNKRYQAETEESMKAVQTRLLAMPQKPQFAGPVCRSISLHELEFASLDEGCRTVGGDDAEVLGETPDNLTNN
jgi:hypothetical protein